LIILKNTRVFKIKDSQIKFYFSDGTNDTYTADSNYSIDDLISEINTYTGVTLFIDADNTDKLVFTKNLLDTVVIVNSNGDNTLSDMLGFTRFNDNITSIAPAYAEVTGTVKSLYISASRLPFYVTLAGTSGKGGFMLGTPFSRKSGKDEVSDVAVYSTPYHVRRGVKNKYTINKERLSEFDTFMYYARNVKVSWINTSFSLVDYQILVNAADNIKNKVDWLKIETVSIDMIEWREE